VIRVLLLIPTLDQSGAEKQLTLLASGLPRDEFDVHVVALTRSGPYARELQAAGVPVIVLGKRFKLDPMALLRLRSLIRSLKPDIVHSWLFAANAYARLVAPSLANGPKILVAERCVDSWKSGWQLWLDRKLIGRTDRLAANAESVAEFYRNLGVPAERIVTIPNGVSGRSISAEERARIRAERLQIPADARVAGYVGRLARQKRGNDLIWAIELLQSLRSDAWLVVAGDGPERESMEQFARDINVHHRVRFLGHRPDALELMAGFDVFWLASEFEGQSNSLMEAMAAGLPVVASDIPANRELVEHQKSGILFPLGDRVALAQVTHRLFDDHALAQQLGAAARERMQQDFSIEKMIARYASLYREIVNGRVDRATGASP